MSKLVSDLFDISELAHHGPENLFISLIKIIGSFVFLFVINWRLAIPLLVLVVVYADSFSYGQNRRMQATFMDNRQKDRRYQFQSAGYTCRDSCGAVFCK